MFILTANPLWLLCGLSRLVLTIYVQTSSNGTLEAEISLLSPLFLRVFGWLPHTETSEGQIISGFTPSSIS